MNDVVIVGGGQAGFGMASTLRQLQYDGAIRLICNEENPPYQRPPLSKDLLRRAVNIPDLAFATDTDFAEMGIDRITAAATDIDTAARRVSLEKGESLEYGHLVLATGARVRTLPGAGGFEGVVGLRGVEDAIRLRDRLHRGGSIVIVGAGFLGLEVAAVCAELGVAVDVIEMQPRVMARGVSVVVATTFENRLREMGVRFHLGVASCQLRTTDARLKGVEVNGSLLKTDLVLVAIGVVPNDELASASGIACRNGILTDARLRTSSQDVWAIGDCAAHPNPHFGRVMRLESIQNALDQAGCAARNIAGTPTVYDSQPWFWTEQAGLKLQIIGNTETTRADQIVLGDPGSGTFTVFHFRNDSLIGAESVNRPKDQLLARKWLRHDQHLTRTSVTDHFALIA
jgi:3-phenylpropionate/trans-cinnamate dioxygenase ferredoxin reductase subunit